MEEQAAPKKVYKEKMYKVDEEEMQRLIERAKKGDGIAQMELLEIFSNFLSKYTALLYHAKWTTENYDTRRFIALYVPDPQVRFFLLRNKLTPGGMRKVNEAIRGVQYMTQRYGDEEDVEQTVRVTFLQCVERYKRKGDIPFSGYLYAYFFFLLKKNVDSFLIDQHGRNTYPLITNDDMEDWEEDNKPVGFMGPAEPSAEELIHAEEIDELWVAGDTAHSPFDSLTIQERQLLKWRYVNGERSSDIANRITEHPNTVREHFNKIKKKIVESAASEGID